MMQHLTTGGSVLNKSFHTNPSSKSHITTQLHNKLARYRYQEGVYKDAGDEDNISLGESAKMTHAKSLVNQVTTAIDNSTDISDYEYHDHHQPKVRRERQHDQQHDQQYYTSQSDDRSTKYTDVSAAQSNIDEQAEVEERKQFEQMTEYVKAGEENGQILMFILDKLTKLQLGMREIRHEQGRITDRLQAAEQREYSQHKEVKLCTEELQEIANNNFKLVQATIKHDQELDSMKQQIQTTYSKVTRGTMTINGLANPDKIPEINLLNGFLKDKLKIGRKLMVKNIYRMNKYKLCFQLMDPNDVKIIFENVSNLKGVKNADNRPYKVEELLPEKEAEWKIRKRDVKAENGRMPFTHQTVISVNKGKLYTGEDENKQVVEDAAHTLPVKEFLLMPKHEEQILDTIPIEKGPTKIVEGSIFNSYSAPVNNTSSVQLIYKKIQNDNLMATHIIGAYRIFGQDHIRLQNYCDDGEYGGGRRILNIMKEENIYGKLIIIVRYKNGGNIGSKRFEAIQEITKKIISADKGLDRGIRRNSEERDLADSLKKAVSWSKNKSNKKDTK